MALLREAGYQHIEFAWDVRTLEYRIAACTASLCAMQIVSRQEVERAERTGSSQELGIELAETLEAGFGTNRRAQTIRAVLDGRQGHTAAPVRSSPLEGRVRALEKEVREKEAEITKLRAEIIHRDKLLAAHNGGPARSGRKIRTRRPHGEAAD
jgi:hypothetical protein